MLQLTLSAWNPSVLAFCLCQLIVVVLLLSGSIDSNKQLDINYIDNVYKSGTAITGLEDGSGDDEKKKSAHMLDDDGSDERMNDAGDDDDDGKDDDQLRKRVEDFIQRMNRVWREEKELR
jgi:hypothetical protein